MRPHRGGRPAPKPGAGRSIRAPWAAPIDDGPLAQIEDHPTLLFGLLPPGPNDAPAFEASVAYTFWESRKRGAQSGTGPTIALARMVRHLGYAVDPNLKESEDSDATLVYVLRWQAVVWQTSGPAPAKNEPPRNHDAIGSQTVLIDAHTGAVLREILHGTVR